MTTVGTPPSVFRFKSQASKTGYGTMSCILCDNIVPYNVRRNRERRDVSLVLRQVHTEADPSKGRDYAHAYSFKVFADDRDACLYKYTYMQLVNAA